MPLKDTPLVPANGEVSHTASTTITITITDVDDRGPWFQPCTKQKVNGLWICQSSGYTGSVILNEPQVRHSCYLEGPAIFTQLFRAKSA